MPEQEEMLPRLGAMALIREKLRYKILGSLFMVLFLFVVIAWLTLQYIEQPSFTKVEQISATNQLKRVLNIIESEQQNVVNWVTDWGYWDDTWEFVAGEHRTFYEDNLSEDYLGTLGLSFAVFLDRDLNVYWAEAYRSEDGRAMPVDKVLSESFSGIVPALLPKSREGVTSGFISTKAGPAIVATHTILKSSGLGRAGGFLILGKLLDETNLSKIDRQLVTKTDLLPASTTQLDQDHWQALDDLVELNKPHSIITHDDRIYALSLIRNLTGQPIGMLRVGMEREITLLGESTMQKSISLLIVAAVAILACLWFMLKIMIVTPTERLTRLVEIMRKELLSDKSGPDLRNTTKALKLWRETMSESAQRDEFGKLVHTFELFSDSLLKADPEVETTTTHDDSTDIRSKRLFLERISSQIAYARESGTRFAVLFLDLNNHYDHETGTHGYEVNPEESIAWTRAIIAEDRSTEIDEDPIKQDFIARYSHDKLAVLLTGDSIEDRAEKLIRGWLEKLADHIGSGQIERDDFTGYTLTCFPDDGDCIESMMEHSRTSLQRTG